MENISDNEESAIFDRSFDTLASETETKGNLSGLLVTGTLTLSSILRFSGYFRLPLLVQV
jgi:hypothetical protein